MKFDAHVFNVGFILYLVAQVIPEPQRANQSFVPRFLYLHTPQLPVITGENSGTGFAAIALSCINFFLFRHYERLLYTMRCPGCRHATLRVRAVTRRTYRLHCKRCGLYTDWHE